MGATIGGSLRSIAFGGRIYAVPADASVKRRLGGVTNEVQPNGDSTARVIQTASSWALTDVQVSVNDTRGDQEALQELAEGGEFETITVEFASGDRYRGLGQITGDIEFDSGNATATLSVMGQGKLERQ